MFGRMLLAIVVLTPPMFFLSLVQADNCPYERAKNVYCTKEPIITCGSASYGKGIACTARDFKHKKIGPFACVDSLTATMCDEVLDADFGEPVTKLCYSHGPCIADEELPFLCIPNLAMTITEREILHVTKACVVIGNQ